MTSILNNPVPAMESASLRSRFASAMVWSVLAAVASRVLGLAATMIAAHLLGKARFGQFGAVLNISNIVGSLAAAGLGVTATRYVADLRVREPERAGRIVALAWLTAVVSGLVLAVLSVATAGWMARTVLHAGSLAGPLRLASVLVLLNGMLAFQNGALAGLEAFRKLARINQSHLGRMLPSADRDWHLAIRPIWRGSSVPYCGKWRHGSAASGFCGWSAGAQDSPCVLRGCALNGTYSSTSVFRRCSARFQRCRSCGSATC